MFTSRLRLGLVITLCITIISGCGSDIGGLKIGGPKYFQTAAPQSTSSPSAKASPTTSPVPTPSPTQQVTATPTPSPSPSPQATPTPGAPTPSPTPQPVGQVLGSVLDVTTSAPIAGASVTLAGLVVTTSNLGVFLFQAVPQGQQTLTVVATGYKPLSLAVNVGPGLTTVNGIQLTKGP